jgi:UDP-N-acetylmuramoyl-L-alanyl-D-glutamate--2,6-diaminopimelate ligase
LRLIDLLDGDLSQVVHGTSDEAMEIAGLTCDSRHVEPGYLFAALPGTAADGRRFIPDALSRGAAAVLAPPGTGFEKPDLPVPLLIDDNPRRRYALMAARFFPGQPETVAAVTGTNGKTSVVFFLRQIWERLGRASASLGTLGVAGLGIETTGSLTTPDPVDLHRTLDDLHRRGVACLAMEASSHGLAQYRLDGIRVTAAAFTNLSRDHLDYHGSMDAYLDSKLRLFSAVMEPGGWAVLNADDACVEDVAAACRARGHRIMTYGASGADVRLEKAEPLADGQRLAIRAAGRSHTLTLPLVGDFQAANVLCALALAIIGGEDAEAAVAVAETLEGPPGRVQRIGGRAGGTVYVDYAHTPDALANVLRALRPHARGRLLVVFGCGGDRDPGKRPEMGRIASELADGVIVTDDNPRGENPADIRRQILDACLGAREIGDRARAIAAGIVDLGPGDLLVVAGKGHETDQIVGDEVRPFNDADAVCAALAECDS